MNETSLSALGQVTLLSSDEEQVILSAIDSLHNENEIDDAEADALRAEVNKISSVSSILASAQGESGIDVSKLTDTQKDEIAEKIKEVNDIDFDDLIAKVSKYDDNLNDLRHISDQLKDVGMESGQESAIDATINEPAPSNDDGEFSLDDIVEPEQTEEGASEDLAAAISTNAFEGEDKDNIALVSEAIDFIIAGKREEAKQAFAKVFENKFKRIYNAAKTGSKIESIAEGLKFTSDGVALYESVQKVLSSTLTKIANKKAISKEVKEKALAAVEKLTAEDLKSLESHLGKEYTNLNAAKAAVKKKIEGAEIASAKPESKNSKVDPKAKPKKEMSPDEAKAVIAKATGKTTTK